MPPDLALSSTLIGSNYPCLELTFMVPKVFEPVKFDCTNKIKIKPTCTESLKLYYKHNFIVFTSFGIICSLYLYRFNFFEQHTISSSEGSSGSFSVSLKSEFQWWDRSPSHVPNNLLTLKDPITTAADDIYKYFLLFCFFQRK